LFFQNNSFSSVRINGSDGGELSFAATGSRGLCHVHVKYVFKENEGGGGSVKLTSLFLELNGRRISLPVDHNATDLDGLKHSGKHGKSKRGKSAKNDYVDAESYEVQGDDDDDDSPFGQMRSKWRKNVSNEKRKK